MAPCSGAAATTALDETKIQTAFEGAAASESTEKPQQKLARDVSSRGRLKLRFRKLKKIGTDPGWNLN